ncbi:reverse transcriptase domain-containing protein [Tanacetum coccineum]
MKKCIAELPMVTAPKPKEELIMYLCAAMEAVSAMLLTERDSRQTPIYFVSRTLQALEINYNSIEKPVLALVHATRRLRKYFQLEAFDITYRPRTSIRGQILADFIAERLDEEGPSIEAEEGEEFTYVLRFEFEASNNEAEYEALDRRANGCKDLVEKVDSCLVANQINGSYKAKEQSMIRYLEKAKALVNNFKTFSIEQVPRSKNKIADALSKIASTSIAHLTKQVLVEILKRKSIEEREILAVVEEEGYCWTTPLIEYLMEGTLPAKTKKERALKIKERQYTMINVVLYRKSFLEPWLRCVGPTQAEYVVKEIHEGSCSMYSGPRSIMAKAIRSGYHWPTMHKDARNIIRKCDDCQTHRSVPQNPQQKFTPITSC